MCAMTQMNGKTMRLMIGMETMVWRNPHTYTRTHTHTHKRARTYTHIYIYAMNMYVEPLAAGGATSSPNTLTISVRQAATTAQRTMTFQYGRLLHRHS